MLLVARRGRCVLGEGARRALSRAGGRSFLALPEGAGGLPGWETVVGWEGTLGAVVETLERASGELLAVVDAELPAPSLEILRRLASVWQGEAAVLPLVEGRIRPLHGVYATGSRGSFRRLRSEGARSVLHAVSALSGRVVGSEVWGDLDPSGGFALKA